MGCLKENLPSTETLMFMCKLLLCMIMRFCRFDFFYMLVPITKSSNCKFGIKIIFPIFLSKYALNFPSCMVVLEMQTSKSALNFWDTREFLFYTFLSKLHILN